jgi:hypothetical protein
MRAKLSKCIIWFFLWAVLSAPAVFAQYSAPSGATSCSAPGANWLTCAISGSTRAGGLRAICGHIRPQERDTGQPRTHRPDRNGNL